MKTANTDRYEVLDNCGAVIATAQDINDAKYAMLKNNNAKLIYDKKYKRATK